MQGSFASSPGEPRSPATAAEGPCQLPIPGTRNPRLQVHPEYQPRHTFHPSIVQLPARRWYPECSPWHSTENL